MRNEGSTSPEILIPNSRGYMIRYIYILNIVDKILYAIDGVDRNRGL